MTEEAKRDLQRLGNAVRIRREELGLQQVDLKERGGPSSTTLSLIERGLYEMTPLMLRRLDKGLDWVNGSAADVLAGYEPTPIAPPVVRTRADRADVHRIWSTINIITGRIATSIHAQSELYEWTRSQLPSSVHDKHAALAEAATEPLVEASAEFAKLVADMATNRQKEKNDAVEVAKEPATPPSDDEGEKNSDSPELSYLDDVPGPGGIASGEELARKREP